jgi:ribosomal protein S18 acetylase RimI-like enzyme
MQERIVTKIVYASEDEAIRADGPENLQRVIEVHQLSKPADITWSVANAAAEVLIGAYAGQFERPHGRLPEGTFDMRFRKNPFVERAIDARQDHMRTEVSNGSRYWFIPAPDQGPDVWAGLLKVSPSQSWWQRKLRMTPNCYLNDIAVHPQWQRQQHASVLLLSGLRYSGFRQDKALALDAFDGNEVANQWFERLNLYQTGAKVRPFRVRGGYELPMVRYSSEGKVALSGIADEIEKRSGLKKVKTVSVDASDREPVYYTPEKG